MRTKVSVRASIVVYLIIGLFFLGLATVGFWFKEWPLVILTGFGIWIAGRSVFVDLLTLRKFSGSAPE
jgi:hypothetical protein